MSPSNTELMIFLAYPMFCTFIVLDIDECLTSPCDGNATCFNTAGTFSCECNTGFTGDGFTCRGKTINFDSAKKLTDYLSRV